MRRGSHPVLSSSLEPADQRKMGVVNGAFDPSGIGVPDAVAPLRN